MNDMQNSEEIHLRDYLNVIKKRKSLFATFLIVVMVVVVVGTFTMTPQYQGVCRVMIEKGESSALTAQNAYSRYDPEFYETQFQLIKSERVAQRVVKILDLNDTWNSYMGIEEGEVSGISAWLARAKTVIKSFLSRAPVAEVAEETETEKTARIAEKLLKGISVAPVKNSHLVAISFQSPNAAFSALVANTIAKAYIEEIYTMKMDTTRRALEWMTKKADEERGNLEKVENELQRYMGANDIITMENRIAVLPQQLAEVSTQLVRAETKREELQAEYQMIQRMSGDLNALANLPEMANSSELKQLKETTQAAKQKIVELSQKYGRKHPVMIKAKDDLALLISNRETLILQSVQKIKNRFELARTSETNLRDQLDRTKKVALSLNEKFIQYGAIKRELDTNRQLFDALILKIREKSMTEEGQTVNLSIVDQAREPEFPIKPRKKVNLLLGLVVGIFGGIGFVFFLEYLDNSVKDPDEFRRRFAKPVLALLPFVDGKEHKGSLDDIVNSSPMSPFAESIKSLRTSILLSHADSAPKTLLVTSAHPGEGKTTVAINLAESLAESGYKVLLIDADLRKPRIHKALKCSSAQGLSSYLAGVDAELFVQKSRTNGADIVSSGPIPPNPSELLIAQRMKALIDYAGEHYDYIICDSAPVLSITDAKILASFFAGTLLTCRAHETTYESVANALHQLQSVNANILGAVINGYNVKSDDYYYQYSYGNYAEQVQPDNS
jgi:capsular exopolysaccharide synthesis family protein